MSFLLTNANIVYYLVFSILKNWKLFMLRSELMMLLARQCSHLPAKDVIAAGNMILAEMEKALCELGRIEFRGLGSWHIRVRDERLAHNPLTGKKVPTSVKYRAHFKPGKALRQRVDRGRDMYPNIVSAKQPKRESDLAYSEEQLEAQEATS